MGTAKGVFVLMQKGVTARSFIQIILIVLLIVAALVSFPSSSFAILNIEALRLRQMDRQQGGNIGFRFERREGNTDNSRFRVDAQAMKKVNSYEHMALIESEFGESNNLKDVDRAMIHLRSTYPFEKKFSAEVYGQLERNQFTRISPRFVLGTGARARWANEETFKVFSGIGGFWSQETIQSAPLTTDAGTRELWRANIYISLMYKFDENIGISTVTYYQPVINDLRDTRVLQTTQADFRVNKLISFSVFYTLNYDSRPAQTVQKRDLHYGTMLNFVF